MSKFSLLLSFFLYCNALVVAAQCPNDSLELVKLYNATDGTNWTNKWDLSKPVKKGWFGVGLNIQGCVAYIDLPENNLVGTVPNLILLSLVELNLSTNPLQGSIPDFNLPNLKVLSFNNNQTLKGNIPNFNLIFPT